MTFGSKVMSILNKNVSRRGLVQASYRLRTGLMQASYRRLEKRRRLGAFFSPWRLKVSTALD